MHPRAPVFTIERQLGSGATAHVFLARLTEPFASLPSGAAVAVKRPRVELQGDATARAAFETEALAGADVQHAGLAGVLHSGSDAEGPFHLLPYVPGATLGATLAGGVSLPEPLLRALATQLAGGLGALHAAGWAHGDIKPDNLRLDERGRAVLLDLGFARRLDETLDSSSDDGAHARLAGSLAYLAPERARGGRPSAASDVFALGVVLYEAATGEHPFDGAQQRAALAAGAAPQSSSGLLLRRSLRTPGGDRLLAALSSARFVAPSLLVPQLSPFFDQLLGEMLARDALRRPSAVQVEQRFREGEAGAWWRAQLDSEQPAGQGAPSDPDAAHLLPLVGREAELEVLLSTWTRVCAGAGELPPGGSAVHLIGPEGSGKSRLTRDFAVRARRSAHPPLYLYGRCSALELQRPCAPILRLLQRWLQLPPGGLPGEREHALVERLVPPTTARTLRVALTTDVEGEVETAVPVALGTWLEALAKNQPLIIFLDDLNFADEGTLAVLTTFAERLAGVRALLVIGEREHEPAALPGPFEHVRARLAALPGAVTMRLEPLDEAAVGRLVAQIFHRSAPQRRIAEVLWSRSRGNPGLLGEILRDLLLRGRVHAFASDDPGLVLEGAPEDLPLPKSLPNVILERARVLTPGERRWLQRLAVVGGRIDPDFLVRAFEIERQAEVDEVVTRLVTTGWLVPAGDRYRFARPALREAVYRAIPQARRVRLHARAARALAPLPGGDGAPGRLSLDDAFQRAFHLRAAGEHSRLLSVLDPLVAALLRRGQPGRVHSLAQWGLEALEHLRGSRARTRQRIRFLEAAADAADRLGTREVQRRWLDSLSDLDLSPKRDPIDLARVYLLHGRFAAGTGQYGLARGMLRNAVDLIAGTRERELESEALRRLAAVQAHIGELDDARELADRAVALAVHPPQEALAQLQLAVVDLLEDHIEEALRGVDRSMRLLRRAADWSLPGPHAAAHLLRGRIYRLAGRPRRALGALQHAVRLAQQAGERRLEQEAGARLGSLLLELDRPREAEARLRDALHIAGEIEDRRGRALAGLWLGILLWEHDDPEGERLIASTAQLAEEIGLGRVEALALAVRARSAQQAGRSDDARRLSLRSHDLLSAKGAELADRIVITGTRAAILHAGGEDAEGAELVKDLRRRMRREHGRIENEVLRRRHRVTSTRLLASALDVERRVWPRVPLDEIEA